MYIYLLVSALCDKYTPTKRPSDTTYPKPPNSPPTKKHTAPFNAVQYAKAQESFLKKKELEDLKQGIKPQPGRSGGGGGRMGGWANAAGSRTQWQVGWGY